MNTLRSFFTRLLPQKTAWPRSRGFYAASLLAALACAAPAARAATFTVTTTADSGAGSLREAVGLADNTNNTDDVIYFAPTLAGATITLSSEIAFNRSIYSFIIDASALPGGITVAGAGTNRLFNFSHGNIELRNLTLTGGKAVVGASDFGAGGAIYSGTPLTLKHCTLSRNTASFAGGAIFCAGLRAESCTFSGNQVPPGSNAVGGGAVYIKAPISKGALVNCTLAGNSAPKGGAILFEGTSSKKL